MRPVGSQEFDDVAVVMITRNEALAIANVVDGSTDATPKIAEERGARVVPEPGGGPAPALLCAVRASERPIVVTVDADDTYPAEVFPELINHIRSGADIAGTDRLGRRPPATMPLANW